MTDQHPLTDEIILSISDESLHMPGYQEDMRAAADWQLEQVVAWGYKHLYPDQIDALVSDMRTTTYAHHMEDD